MITTLLATNGIIGMHVDSSRSVVWLVQSDGLVLSIDLVGDVKRHQRLAVSPVDIAGSATYLAVAANDGSLWSIDPDDPGTSAIHLGTLHGVPTQITVSARSRWVAAAVGGAVVAISTRTGRMRRLGLPIGAPARWMRRLGLPIGAPARRVKHPDLPAESIDLGDWERRHVPLPGIFGVTVLDRATAASVNDPVNGQAWLRRVGGFGPGAASFALPPLGRVGTSADHAVIFGAHPSANTVSAWWPSSAEIRTGEVAALNGTIIEAQGLADGRVAVLTDQMLAVVDSITDLNTVVSPRITTPGKPLFVASWVRLDYDLGTSGLTHDDVTFAVPEGPEAGIVSHVRDDGSTYPSPILVAGGRLGTYKVVMIETATNSEIADAEFTVTNEWADDDSGPSMMITGQSSEFAGDSGWGGGPNAPQNLGDITHSGSWNVLVMLVDTSTARWPAGTLDQSRTDVLDHVINGFNVGGVYRSARVYYEENSANQLTIAARNNAVFGPVSMPDGWDTYFSQISADDERWAPKGKSWQAFLTQAIYDGDVTAEDLQAVDSVVFVPFSPDAVPASEDPRDGGGDRFAWPYANLGKHHYLLGANVLTDQGDVACLQVPLNFAAQDGRQTHSTLSHELGHNLGLLDVYNMDGYPSDVSSRITSRWEMMAGSSDSLPHYSVANKMRMGWLSSSQVKLFNFSGSGGVDQTITLHAAALGNPPRDRFRAIEIRLGDGWNYYVEYRSEQPEFISDNVPADRRVVLTDVVSENYSPPILRPRILFVPNDLDGDGRILDVSEDFEDTDPGTGFELSVTVVSTSDDNAVVRVKYGSNGRPELGIRPWDGGPTYKSPDIEVRNAKNAADDNWADVPWAGRANTVVGKVKNNGDFDATDVSVEFFVTEITTGEGPWESLGTDVRNVPAGAKVEFTTNWTPPDREDEDMHYCILVRIKPYQDPNNPEILDANMFNNEARSNYGRFYSTSASPFSRNGTAVMLSNPFGERTMVSARVRQTHKFHRVFIDHTWLTLEPGAPRPVQVLDQALDYNPKWSSRDRDLWYKKIWTNPNLVVVDGWARVPHADECISQMPTGGMCLSVQAGRATATRLQVKHQMVYGEVIFVDNGNAVPDRGTVLVEVIGKEATWTVTALTLNGKFEAVAAFKGAAEVRAHYLGAFTASPSESERLAF